jgi:RNA polymerase sigma factor (sigma-70 family)
MMDEVEEQRSESAIQPWPDDLVSLYVDERMKFVRMAYLMCGRADVAEDLVHDAFVASATRWADVERPVAYVRAAVANRCRDWLRRQKLDARQSGTVESVSVQEPDELWDALGHLEPRRRMAVVLRYYEDLPDAEIAAVLGCRPSTVRSLLHRGLKDLRREVKR